MLKKLIPIVIKPIKGKPRPPIVPNPGMPGLGKPRPKIVPLPVMPIKGKPRPPIVPLPVMPGYTSIKKSKLVNKTYNTY